MKYVYKTTVKSGGERIGMFVYHFARMIDSFIYIGSFTVLSSCFARKWLASDLLEKISQE